MPILFIDDNKGIIYSETAAILFITPEALKKLRVVIDQETFGKINLDEEPRFCRQETKRLNGYDCNIQRSLPCLFDETMNFFYPVIGKFLAHEKEELRLSLKIAKKNVEINPENKYYLDQLNKIQKQWNELNA